ncbi:pyridoxal phosphate-dependent transferase [Infundibulicybe gibba]|nr:pyridoxal phosphate-dependent transferase [Infundibulicybe gibba]
MPRLQLPEPAELYKTTPPKFGHPMHKLFPFDPEYVNLNHGSYGSLPLLVLSSCNTLSEVAEANPDLFNRLTYQPLLVDTDECVLVQNTSLGLNVILRNIEWEKEDTIVIFNTTYGSTYRTAHNLGDIPPYPTVSQFTLLFPTTRGEIIDRFRDHLRSLPKTGKRVAIIDTIISNPGIHLPWEEMTEVCRQEGVWSVLDAAHSIGQEVNINLSESKPDFWVSNCHKWLFTKRSCAVLYVPERNQHIIKTSIPTSHTYISPKDRTGPNFVEQFEWNGTIDFVPFLSVAAALDFRKWVGGEEVINAYCHSLAMKGGKRLAEVMGTRQLDPEGAFTLNMVNVELPFPAEIQPTIEIDLMFKNKLLVSYKAYSAHFYHNGRWWTRCSAQIWNEVEDFEKLGRIYLSVCAEIVKELGYSELKL